MAGKPKYIFNLSLTEQKQRIIVENKMEFGQIQLGVKKGSGKSLDRVPSQGFFYAGGGIVNAPENQSTCSRPLRWAIVVCIRL